MKLNNNIAVSESGFVFDPNSGESFSLNKTGREILNLLKESKSITEIRSIILSKYEVSESAFNRYFEDFTQMLKHYHLIDLND